jgi:hypothetical protein
LLLHVWMPLSALWIVPDSEVGQRLASETSPPNLMVESTV